MTKENPHRGRSAVGAVEIVNKQKDNIALPSKFQLRNETAQSDARGFEAVMVRDRAFFERHPFLSEYTREIMPGEFPPPIIPVPPGYQLQGFIKVRRISANLRKRIVLTAIVVPKCE